MSKTRWGQIVLTHGINRFVNGDAPTKERCPYRLISKLQFPYQLAITACEDRFESLAAVSAIPPKAATTIADRGGS